MLPFVYGTSAASTKQEYELKFRIASLFEFKFELFFNPIHIVMYGHVMSLCRCNAYIPIFLVKLHRKFNCLRKIEFPLAKANSICDISFINKWHQQAAADKGKNK